MGIVDAKNVYEESSGMFFITGLIGLRPLRIFTKMFPGYIYLIIILFVYYALYFLTVGNTLELYETMRVYSTAAETRIWQTYLIPFFVSIMIIPSVLNSSKIRQIYIELNFIDEKLKLLNIRFDHATFARMEFAQICEMIVLTIMFNLLEYYPQIGPETTRLFDLAWIVNSFPQFVNSIALMSFVTVATKIRRHFEAINEFIINLPIFEKNVITTLETDMNNVLRLRLLNRIHEKLINAAINLIEAHGLILLTSFAVYFLVCCAHLRTISLVFNNANGIVDLMVEILWVIFYLGKYFYVTEACHSVTLQGKLSSRLLYEKWTDVDHPPLKQEMEVQARRMGSRNLQLTACNFFVIDYPAMKKIIIALAAYLFFVSQLSTPCNKNK